MYSLHYVPLCRCQPRGMLTQHKPAKHDASVTLLHCIPSSFLSSAVCTSRATTAMHIAQTVRLHCQMMSVSHRPCSHADDAWHTAQVAPDLWCWGTSSQRCRVSRPPAWPTWDLTAAPASPQLGLEGAGPAACLAGQLTLLPGVLAAPAQVLVMRPAAAQGLIGVPNPAPFAACGTAFDVIQT